MSPTPYASSDVLDVDIVWTKLAPVTIDCSNLRSRRANSIDTSAFLSTAKDYVVRDNSSLRTSLEMLWAELIQPRSGQDRSRLPAVYLLHGAQQPHRPAGLKSLPVTELRLGSADIEQRVFGKPKEAAGNTRDVFFTRGFVTQVKSFYDFDRPPVAEVVASLWRDIAEAGPRLHGESGTRWPAESGPSSSAVAGTKLAALLNSVTSTLHHAVVSTYDRLWRLTHTAREVIGLSRALRHSPHHRRHTTTGADCDPLRGCIVHGYVRIAPPGHAVTSSASVCRGPNSTPAGSEIQNPLWGLRNEH